MGSYVQVRGGVHCLKRNMLVSTIVALLCVPGTAVYAQNADDDKNPPVAASSSSEPAKLESVEVVGHTIEETRPLKLAQYGSRLQVIEGEMIADTGIVDVGTVLQMMAPSLYLVPKSGAFDYVNSSMEGSRAEDILWTVDGVRINNRLYPSTSPLDTIPASMIERIEILEGGQGLFYGTQAVAGVVNIVTKSFVSKGTDGDLSLGADTNDGRHVSGNVRTAFGPHRLVAYASSDSADGYQPFPTEDYQPSSTDHRRGYDVQTVGLKYAVGPGSVHFSGGYQRTDAKLDYPYAYEISSYISHRKEDLGHLKLSWTANDDFGLYVKGYYHRWNTYLDQYRNVIGGYPGEVKKTKDNLFWGYTDYGINAVAEYDPGHGLSYTFGYDYQNYNGKDESLLIADMTQTVNAGIAQIHTTSDMFEKLRLSAGVRYNQVKGAGSSTIWNVSGKYDITQNLYLKGTGGTSYRLPSAYELFAVDPCCTQGNPDLSPEKSRNLNMSIGGYFDLGGRGGSWELVGFTRKIQNLIATQVDPATLTPIFQNTPGESKVNGWLVTATLPLSDSLTVTPTYTKTHAKAGGLQIDEVPKSSAKLLFNLSPLDSPFGGMLMVNYLGDSYQTLGIGRKMYGNYWLMDLTAYVRFGDKKRQRVSLRVANLTDRQYVTNLSQVTPDFGGPDYAARNIGPPRTYHLTYSYAF